ncbi:hypothetical protein HNP46_005698 [Pseudomonas nitritireducens]|uniref:Uncharacterized protein n=1 Tax=Pseudomonas nitroreducens TaxID=46680 RepID=A0A7W7KQG5_PSENT|nr:hypothetical protein [Pseudomonas nitritireducens]MBB4866791.1 hypothetical protein [Pseudomonas nitritireducens]
MIRIEPLQALIDSARPALAELAGVKTPVPVDSMYPLRQVLKAIDEACDNADREVAAAAIAARDKIQYDFGEHPACLQAILLETRLTDRSLISIQDVIGPRRDVLDLFLDRAIPVFQAEEAHWGSTSLLSTVHEKTCYLTDAGKTPEEDTDMSPQVARVLDAYLQVAETHWKAIVQVIRFCEQRVISEINTYKDRVPAPYEALIDWLKQNQDKIVDILLSANSEFREKTGTMSLAQLGVEKLTQALLLQERIGEPKKLVAAAKHFEKAQLLPYFDNLIRQEAAEDATSSACITALVAFELIGIKSLEQDWFPHFNPVPGEDLTDAVSAIIKGMSVARQHGWEHTPETDARLLALVNSLSPEVRQASIQLIRRELREVCQGEDWFDTQSMADAFDL